MEIRKRYFYKVVVSTALLLSVVNGAAVSVQASGIASYDRQDICNVVAGTNTSDNSDGDNSGGNSTSEGDIPNTQNIKEIYKILHGEYGFSAVFIAGILGNWQQESGIDPRTVQDHLTDISEAVAVANENNPNAGIGYGQWTFDRHTALVQWGKEKFSGKWYTTEAELDYMVHGDGGNVPILKDCALNSSSDPFTEAVTFHQKWERSADSDTGIKEGRAGNAVKIYDWMKKNGMDGDKDPSKINKLSGSSSGSGGDGESSVIGAGDSKDYCDTGDTGESSEAGTKSVKPNGKSGKVIGGAWTYDELPEQYKKALTLPKFKQPDDPSASPFQGDLAGQCTEGTYLYMKQLWSGEPQTMGNGGDVWESYKSKGAKITDDPTVGYGMSAKGAAGATGGLESAGHTGVVVAVFENGSFLLQQFNYPPHAAPSRVPVFTLIDGNNSNSSGSFIHFFSGLGKAKN